MIEVTYYNSKESHKCSLEELKSSAKNVLIDCKNPSKDELKLIEKKYEIKLSDIERALDPDEKPIIEAHEKYTRITISTSLVKDLDTKTISISFLIFDNFIILLRKKDVSAFQVIKSMPKQTIDEIFSKDISNILYNYLHFIVKDYFYIIDLIEEEMQAIENRLFKKFNNEKIIRRIFDLRKTLIYFQKSLIGNKEVLLSIDKEYVKQIKKEDLKKYKYLYMDISQSIDMVNTYRDLVNSSMDIYMSAVSNNMNEVMKRLTVYASYVLVPTLISGIYGMNFQWMPETTWKYGYFLALFMMLFSIFIIRHHFKKKGWI